MFTCMNVDTSVTLLYIYRCKYLYNIVNIVYNYTIIIVHVYILLFNKVIIINKNLSTLI